LFKDLKRDSTKSNLIIRPKEMLKLFPPLTPFLTILIFKSSKFTPNTNSINLSTPNNSLSIPVINSKIYTSESPWKLKKKKENTWHYINSQEKPMEKLLSDLKLMKKKSKIL